MPQTEAADERDTPAVNLSQLTESSRLCGRGERSFIDNQEVTGREGGSEGGREGRLVF